MFEKYVTRKILDLFIIINIENNQCYEVNEDTYNFITLFKEDKKLLIQKYQLSSNEADKLAIEILGELNGTSNY